MAHWAEIDENNIVLRVIVTDNNDPNGDEGYQWLIDNLGGTWLQTSYNTAMNTHATGKTPLRKNYAAIGYHYDETLDAFIPPKPDGYTDPVSGIEYTAVLDEERGIWNMVASE